MMYDRNMKTTIEINDSLRLQKDQAIDFPDSPYLWLVREITESMVTVIRIRWYHRAYFRVVNFLKRHTRPRFQG